MGKLAGDPLADVAGEFRSRHSRSAPAESVAPEAARFLSARGLADAHARVRALVGEGFPSLKCLATTLETDPDAPHLTAVRLHATVCGPVEKAMACKDARDGALAKEEGDSPCPFVVTMKVVQ